MKLSFNDLKNFANFQPLVSNFSQSLEHFFSHCRLEQFGKQNTISELAVNAAPRTFDPLRRKQGKFSSVPNIESHEKSSRFILIVKISS